MNRLMGSLIGAVCLISLTACAEDEAPSGLPSGPERSASIDQPTESGPDTAPDSSGPTETTDIGRDGDLTRLGSTPTDLPRSGPKPRTELVDGCPGQTLREGIPDDFVQPGPWSVGAVQTTIDGITVEVWYPAEQGSSRDAAPVVYDTRLNMPLEERTRIPDSHNPVQPCDCFRELPLDQEAGPYPLLVFVHGTAGFRTSNLENAVHWASRGFVVMAADHPGIQLCDLFAMFTQGTPCGNGARDQGGQARAMLDAISTGRGDLAFLEGHVALDKVGIMGHSAGASAVSGLGDVADVMVLYAASRINITGDRVQSVLFAGGDEDGVTPLSPDGYENVSGLDKRYLTISRGGHLVGGSLCDLRDPTNPANDIVDIASEFELGGPSFASILPLAFGALFDGCNELTTDDEPFINGARGIDIVNGITAAVFEERLHCASTADDRARSLVESFGDDVNDYRASVLP